MSDVKKGILSRLKAPKATASDYGLKGVHTPMSPGSGHSLTGILATGAKPGSPEAKQAKKQHKQTLSEMKQMPKPALKNDGTMSYRDMQKKEAKMKKATLGMKTEDESVGSKETVNPEESVKREPKAIAMEDGKNAREQVVLQTHAGHVKNNTNVMKFESEQGLSFRQLFKVEEGEFLAKPKK